ncbi:IBR domain, a half RING-finger domain-containing protein [Hirsutella rhossiliensis]|uniref:RBR-type E3 ubiquitin transferase n=1 Tax=Hirsutella rhossiliensis TaxID=111463 RepID=A0A9P8N4I6_9HYPO|nr:IBR domain, a half RING-finger domain-containing protein [Hirsutella rhossiliensis]KAH0965801.1 IBR domain, a half RING-finger domain-containing protein [Hirsutella rhossiliensis]
MRLEAYRDADDGHGRSRRRRRYQRSTLDWKSQAEQPRDSLPHPRNDRLHSSGRRASRRSESTSSRTLDAADSTMPPPPHLARSSTDAYRRPRHWMAYGDGGDSVGGRRRPRRDASPTYHHRAPPLPEYSGYSSASGRAYGGGGDDGDDFIEVVEVADDDDDDDDGSSRHRGDRQSSRDEYMLSSADRGYHRQRTRQHHADPGETVVRRRHSFSNSPARASSKTADRSASSRQGRRLQLNDVIEDSRPPVSSKRSTVRRRNRSADVIHHEDRPREPSRVRSSRSRAGSVSGGPSGILGSIFGTPSPRRAPPEERAKEPKAAKRVACVICMGDVSLSKVARLKCGHSMCRSCLERIFKLSITDPQHMPPRCCTQDHIPVKHVERLFDDSFKSTWNRKFAEFSTKNRLYCPSRKCGEWIKPANIFKEKGRKVALCGRCKTKVCGHCNAKWHGAEDCPQDEETARLLAQAQEEGWKRCYRCKAVVELKEGCNHMTCRCGGEFCMICGVKWKGCDCPWFNDGGFLGDMLDHADIELRNHHPVTMTAPARPRRRSYHEEMPMRRRQGQWDTDTVRHLQYPSDFHNERDVMGGVGDVHGIGNAAGHFMNDDYRGSGRYRVPARVVTLDRSADYVDDERRTRNKRAGSMERRLADRFSETRPGMGIRARMGPMALPMPHGPDTGPPAAPQRRTLRQHSLEEELYNRQPRTVRSGRVVEARLSRTYEDESEIHAPGSRRRGFEKPPTSSDMAGLNGRGQGMNRVSQWRSFVEPGIPDGESTVGHA